MVFGLKFRAFTKTWPLETQSSHAINSCTILHIKNIATNVPLKSYLVDAYGVIENVLPKFWRFWG